MIKNTEENRNKLAIAVVDCMDLDDLIEYAVNRLEEFYKTNNKQFQEEFEEFFEEGE